MGTEISNKFLKFIQELNSIAQVDLFINIKFKLLQEIEKVCDEFSDHYLKRLLNKLDSLLEEAKLDFSPIHLQINQLYWEIFVYFWLKYKKAIDIKKVPEDEGTPDYEINFKGNLFSLEVKTPAMVDALNKYKEYQEEALEKNIEAEKEAKRKRVGISIRIIQPYFKERSISEYSPDSTKIVIETLIEKIEQNFKPKQFKSEYSKRILCIVLDQLPLLSKPVEASVPVYPCFYSKSCVSGELWYVAFGKIGMLILKPAEFEGRGNIDGVLEREGILISKENYINALIFLIPESDKICSVGFYKLKDNEGKYLDNKALVEFLDKVVNYVNNEFNENDYYFKFFELEGLKNES